MRKKIYQLILSSMLIFTAFGSNAAFNSHKEDPDAAMKAKITAMTDEQKLARSEEIKARIKEIKAIDKTTLTKADRKALKDELRSIQKEAKFLGRHGLLWTIAGIAVIVLLVIWIF